MARIEDQRILIYCNREENIKAPILDAVYLALKLEKEVCLFANYTNTKEHQKLKQRVQTYAETIKKDIPNLDISILLLEGTLENLMRELGEKYNSIML